MNKNGNTLSWRVTNLEKSYDELSLKLDEIMENHIPHLREDIASIKSWMKVWATLNFGAIIIGILASKII